jgi:predicted ester cyclase
MRVHKPHLFERHRGDEREAETEHAEDGDEPLPGYERIDETELIADLRHHPQTKLEEIEVWERSHQSRTRVLNKLHYLRQQEPLPDYDELDVEEIEAALEYVDLQTVNNVRAYERKFRDRPHVFEVIDVARRRELEKQPLSEGYQHTSYGPSVSQSVPRAPGPGKLAANKALVTALYAEVVNSRDLDAIDRLLSEEFTHNGHARQRVAQREEFAKLLEAFPDLQTEIDLILAEGDLVAVHQRWAGTHGESETDLEQGRRIEFTSTAVLRVNDGLIAEAWDEVDLEGLADLYSGGG